MNTIINYKCYIRSDIYIKFRKIRFMCWTHMCFVINCEVTHENAHDDAADICISFQMPLPINCCYSHGNLISCNQYMFSVGGIFCSLNIFFASVTRTTYNVCIIVIEENTMHGRNM